MKNQTTDILTHLRNGKRLTQKEAINLFGAYRLSSIIHMLRGRGHTIVSIPLEVPTRYRKADGTIKNARIVEYKLMPTANTNNTHNE